MVLPVSLDITFTAMVGTKCSTGAVVISNSGDSMALCPTLISTSWKATGILPGQSCHSSASMIEVMAATLLWGAKM